MALDLARKAIELGIERGLHVGAQLYVSRDGQPVADLAFGLARDGVAMTPDTIMLWMSATKPITVVALAQVWERGKIALDDPVAKYIPAFGAKGKDRITIRHVLTHTGGFRPAVGPWTADPWDNIIAQICAAEIALLEGRPPKIGILQIRPDSVLLSTPDGDLMLKNDFVFALTGYSPDLPFLNALGITLDEKTLRPRTDSKTLESERAGVYLAGVIVAGMHTNEIFIENGRFHGKQIAEAIAAKLS